MLKIVALAALAVVALVLIYAATRPNTFRIKRSTDITASPQKIFAFINDFKAWPQWSPYEKLDPTMQRALSGAEAGKGAAYEWSGNAKAGAGRMEIIESSAPEKVVLNLVFTKPFKANNIVTFNCIPEGDVTHVSWLMEGPLNYMAKIMHLLFNMDRMIGRDFEKGLAELKKVSEA